jgi:V/A-type H+/Na+-transporting ATPase subunit E
MANIDNLKLRILSDDREKANAIESEAKAKAQEIVDSAKLKAQTILEEIKVKAEKDGKDKKDRIIARAQLDARNSVLSAKQETIDRVLGLAAEKVVNMNNEEYSDLVEKLLISGTETGEEEIIFSEKDKKRVLASVIDKVNEMLISKGKKGLLKVSDETRDISSGFILKRGGLEINCSIESRIRTLRDSLESDLANLLFEGR